MTRIPEMKAEIGLLLKEQNLDEARAKLEELNEEIETATILKDDDRALRAQDEKDQIMEYLEAASGLGGRARKLSTPAEKARSKIQIQIKAACDKIRDYDLDLFEHLASSISTGFCCCYSPNPDMGIIWQVERKN